jgi:hypothetical protein
MRRSWRAPLAVTVIAAALPAGCGVGSSPAATQVSTTKTGSQPSSSPPASNLTSAPASPRPSGPPTSVPVAPGGPPTSVPVAPGAGAPPQTRAFPSADSAAFDHAMQDLWLAVTTGNARLAPPAFFPRASPDQPADADPITTRLRPVHIAPDWACPACLVAGTCGPCAQQSC